MKVIIRIRGKVKLERKTEETFRRINLYNKFNCIVISNPNKSQEGMINALESLTAYGDINEKTLEMLIEKRGQWIDKKKKMDFKAVAQNLMKGQSLKENNLKPYFRLHPPRGGIKSKVHFPKGVLGNHKEKINDLIKRML